MAIQEVDVMLKKIWLSLLEWLKGPDPLDPKEPRQDRPPRC